MSKKRLVSIFTSTNGKPIEVGNKPDRNDKCPCGSLKKYKNCCWSDHQTKVGYFK